MTDRTTFEAYIKVLQDQLRVTERLIVLENRLAEYASANRTAELESLVRESQPDLMQFRGTDIRRGKLHQALGFGSRHLPEILTMLSPEDAAELRPVAEALTSAASRLQEAQNTAERIMKVRLNDVNTVIALRSDIPRAFQGAKA